MTDDKRSAKLASSAEESAQIRAMCQTPGFKLLQKKFEDKIKRASSIILDMNTPDDKVKEIRQRIHVWTEITCMIKSLILTGDYASKILRDEDLEVQSTPALSGQGE